MQSMGGFRHTDEVDTSQLLKRLEQTTSKETLAKSTLKAIYVGRLAKGHLIHVVSLDLVKLLNDGGMIRRQAAEFSQTLCSLIIFVHLN